MSELGVPLRFEMGIDNPICPQTGFECATLATRLDASGISVDTSEQGALLSLSDAIDSEDYEQTADLMQDCRESYIVHEAKLIDGEPTECPVAIRSEEEFLN